MKLASLLLLACAALAQDPLPPADAVAEVKKLTVMIRRDGVTRGAGIIFSVRKDLERIYVATARHLIREDEPAGDFEVQFSWLPGEDFPATVLASLADKEMTDLDGLDLAVLSVKLGDTHADTQGLRLERLGDPFKLARGTVLWAMGAPPGQADWSVSHPLSSLPAMVIHLPFEAGGFAGGYSGGPVFDRGGLIQAMSARGADAVRIDVIRTELDDPKWSLQVQWRRPDEAPPPDLAGARRGNVPKEPEHGAIPAAGPPPAPAVEKMRFYLPGLPLAADPFSQMAGKIVGAAPWHGAANAKLTARLFKPDGSAFNAAPIPVTIPRALRSDVPAASASFGPDTPGQWPAGKYRAEMTDARGNVVATGTFEIVPEPLKVTSLRFFDALKLPPNPLFVTLLPTHNHYIWAWVTLHGPTGGKAQTVTLKTKWHAPDGHVFADPDIDAERTATDVDSTASVGWGSKEGSVWAPGKYLVEVLDPAGNKIETSFEIVPDPAPAPATTAGNPPPPKQTNPAADQPPEGVTTVDVGNGARLGLTLLQFSERWVFGEKSAAEFPANAETLSYGLWVWGTTGASIPYTLACKGPDGRIIENRSITYTGGNPLPTRPGTHPVGNLAPPSDGWPVGTYTCSVTSGTVAVAQREFRVIAGYPATDALVFVIGNALLSRKPSVFVERREIARIHSFGYFALRFRAGKYSVCLEKEERNCNAFTFEGGKTYYLGIDNTSGGGYVATIVPKKTHPAIYAPVDSSLYKASSLYIVKNQKLQ